MSLHLSGPVSPRPILKSSLPGPTWQAVTQPANQVRPSHVIALDYRNMKTCQTQSFLTLLLGVILGGLQLGHRSQLFHPWRRQ